MDKKQAAINAKKIFLEANQKADAIIKKAKKDGTWKQGLDANKELFAELDKETQEKIKRLHSMIDGNKRTD